MRALDTATAQCSAAIGIALTVIAGLPASSQTDRTVAKDVMVRTIPNYVPDLRRPPKPAEQSVELRDLPESIARIANPPGWATTRQPRPRPGAIGPGAGGAAYVERIANSAGAPSCALPGRGGPNRNSDSYDFRPLAKGFRVLDIRIEQLSPPFPLDSAAISTITYTHTDGKLTPSSTLFDGIFVRSRYGWRQSSPDPRFPITCWSGYRLHVTVRGPANVDPITGNPIRRSQVN